jgi:hypothetical protein
MTHGDRLPRNFHRTFKPERQYLAAMLKYAASGQEGDYQAIGLATGIPMGASTGKAPAILDYCRGMGLIRLARRDRSAVKKPELTPFGRIVLLEDPFLKSGISQWIAHLNLCGSDSGADVWYQTFFAGTASLGMSFEEEKLEAHLSVVYGIEKADLIGPLIGMYEDEAAFRVCGALSEESSRVVRKAAPVGEEYGFAYGALLLQQMADSFRGARQVTVTELDAKAGWRTIPGWDIGTHQRVLDLIERKGVVEVDRHMEPWLLRPAAEVDSTWRRIYDDLL